MEFACFANPCWHLNRSLSESYSRRLSALPGDRKPLQLAGSAASCTVFVSFFDECAEILMQATRRWKLAYRRSFEGHKLGAPVGHLGPPVLHQSGMSSVAVCLLPNDERPEMSARCLGEQKAGSGSSPSEEVMINLTGWWSTTHGSGPRGLEAGSMRLLMSIIFMIQYIEKVS